MIAPTMTAHYPGSLSVPVPVKYAPMWWHTAGRTYTASGYGRRIPTARMVQLPGSTRWRRVYVCIYSNRGTAYVDGPSRTSRDWIVISD